MNAVDVIDLPMRGFHWVTALSLIRRFTAFLFAVAGAVVAFRLVVQYPAWAVLVILLFLRAFSTTKSKSMPLEFGEEGNVRAGIGGVLYLGGSALLAGQLSLGPGFTATVLLFAVLGAWLVFEAVHEGLSRNRPCPV